MAPTLIALACSWEMLHLDITKLNVIVFSVNAPLLMTSIVVFRIDMAEIWPALKASSSTLRISEFCISIPARDEKKAARGILGITTLINDS